MPFSLQEKLFNHLVESYKPHLDVDPCYASYLDRISQIFFGSSSSKRKNDSFGGLFGNILKGIGAILNTFLGD